MNKTRKLKQFNETMESLCHTVTALALQQKLQDDEYSNDRSAMINELQQDISDFKDLLLAFYNEKEE